MTIDIRDIGDRYMLTFTTGTLGQTDEVVFNAGHEPNGYFWESFAEFTWPELAAPVDFDSEAGTFVAYAASEEALVPLKAALESTVADSSQVGEIMRRAEAAGVQFDD